MTNILLPMALHVVWCATLYVLLTLARAPVVWGIGRRTDGSNPFADIQGKISANLSNQFEWPLFFHIFGVILIATGNQEQSTYVLLGWLFIVGRVLHSVVQLFSSNIRLRGSVFTLNFMAVVMMWALLMIDVIQS
jgi:hypothetical protein